MKNKILVGFLALILAVFLVPSSSRAFLQDWYLDLDGSGGTAPVQISEYLDTVGPAYVNNTITGQTGTFQEWGVFNSLQHDGGTPYTGFAGYDLSAIFTASGNVTLGGALQFLTGSLEIYSDPYGDFSTTNDIYGANNGTLIGSFNLITGTGSVDPTGVPNGQITTIFESTFLAQGYWFDENMNDLSDINPISFVIGFGTTNASWVENPSQTVIDEIYTEFAGAPNGIDPPNTPPGDLFVSGNGQWRINVVPEPASMLLLGVGMIGLAGLGRKRFFKKS